jgi:hypothetical protein
MERLFAALLLLATLAPAAELYPVREVKPGMKGWGLTWTRGPEPIRFEAEVVGVLEGFVPGTPTILARLSHPELDQSFVFAGMSGSPVYIGDRLLGAVAYTWSFLKEPVAGITPAEAMKGDLGGTAGPGAVDAAALLDAPLREVPALVAAAFRRPLPGGAALAPLAFRADAVPTAFAALFSSMAMAPAAAAGGAPDPPPYPLEGGYPIGAALAWGDASFFASGTITFREGDTLYAFGHPFLGLGEVVFPLLRAHPVAVLARTQSSFRLSNPGEAVGTLEADGLNGIRAALGKAAPSVPVDVTVNGRVRRFATVRQRIITPVMAANGMASILQKELGPGPFGTAALTVTLRPAGGETMVFREAFSGPGAVDGLLGAALLYPVLLGANPWREVAFESIAYAVTHETADRRERVTGASADRGVVRPGETVKVTVRTEDLQGRAAARTFAVAVPSGVLPETFSLVVGSGAEIEEGLKKAQPLKPQSYEGLVQVLRETRAQADLAALWKLGRPALLDDDRLYPAAGPDLAARVPGAQKLPATYVKLLLESLPRPLTGTVEIKFKTRD